MAAGIGQVPTLQEILGLEAYGRMNPQLRDFYSRVESLARSVIDDNELDEFSALQYASNMYQSRLRNIYVGPSSRSTVQEVGAAEEHLTHLFEMARAHYHFMTAPPLSTGVKRARTEVGGDDSGISSMHSDDDLQPEEGEGYPDFRPTKRRRFEPGS